MRFQWLFLSMFAWGIASGCSSKPGPSTSQLLPCLNGDSKVDCRAVAEIRLVSPARAVADQSSIDVQAGSTAIGGSVVLDFNVVNAAAITSAAVLRVHSVTLSEDGSSGAFSCTGSDGSSCNTLTDHWQDIAPPGGEWANTTTSQTFRIHYKKLDEKIHTAHVCVQASGDPALPAEGLCFALTTKLGKPHLKVAPQSLDFGHVLTGKSSDPQGITVTNTGEAPLVVTQVNLTGESGFSLNLPENPTLTSPKSLTVTRSLEPGQSETWQARYNATDAQKKSANVEIHSNDSSQPVTLVGLAANTNVPCLQIVQSPEVPFGAVVVGEIGKQGVDVKNCGTAPLALTGITLEPGANPAFALDFGKDATPSVDTPMTIALNGLYHFSATYTPAELSQEVSGTLVSDIGLLLVESNADPKETKLTGVGVTSKCPKPVIKVAEGEEVVPQTVLHLTGKNSLSPGGGSIAKYKWTAKKQPLGSAQKFVPNATSMDTTFTVNAAGQYDFCLQVTDNKGVSSCTDACISVLVTPSDSLHAELLWHTPGDKDETDTGAGAGSDLDIHLAHQLAGQPDIDCDGDPDPWFDNTFDCYWHNPTPGWGIASTTQQSGKLDLDDTDGAGPENVSVPQPEGNANDLHTYSLGVHYWNDHGMGHSWAIVRVYVLGTLAAEYNQPHPGEPAGDGAEMKALDMWYVGKINWPNDAVGGTGPVMTTCYQTGSACIEVKNPADPKAGKMWQPLPASGSGKTVDWCITPCYISGNAPTGGGLCGK